MSVKRAYPDTFCVLRYKKEMKDKISRLAKGIMEEEPGDLRVRPARFDEIVYSDRPRTLSIEAESAGGHSIRGVLFCDESRVDFTTRSFTGRMNHLSFTFDASGLHPGDTVSGSVKFLTNAGEAEIPFTFTAGKPEPVPESAEKAEPETGEKPEKVPFIPSVEEEKQVAFLRRHIPEDDELLLTVSGELIRLSAQDSLAFSIYKEAIRRELPVTHLYESYMAAYPENDSEPMLREVLLYYSYERDIPASVADKLYRNVIASVSGGPELYALYESDMRDYAMKSVLLGRINANLPVIYDRMIYPDMIDGRAAAVLPDLLKAHMIRVEDVSVKTVHVVYPELLNVKSQPVTDGVTYVPVYFDNAAYEFLREDGTKAEGVHYTDRALMNRPDLMKRCLELSPSHPMLELSAVKEILSRGIASDNEKEILVTALRELALSESFRNRVIRALCDYGGDTAWIDEYSPAELGNEAGGLALSAYLDAGRYREAYLCLRMLGMENVRPEDLSRLAVALLSREEKPVTGGTDTDRFFLCMCAKIFRETKPDAYVLRFLCEEYEGSTEDMFAVLEAALSEGIPVHELSERTLSAMLFAGIRDHLDEVFREYVENGVQKEVLLKAYFTLRMTDYFEKEDRTVADAAFDALRSYLCINKNHESLPVIYLIALTAYFSEKESLSEDETKLCQKLTDILVSRDLVFRYTKNLRKKVRVPASICERFFVEYRGVKNSDPRMIARIRPDETEYRPVAMKKVYKEIYVAGVVLFYGDEMHYMIYDDSLSEEPCEEGVLKVKKVHGKDEDRYALLNRMTEALSKDSPEDLRNAMLKYCVSTEVSRKLFSSGF